MPGLIAFALSGCASLLGVQPDGVTVTAATAITPALAWRATGPGAERALEVRMPFCRIEGRIEGNIGFELWLPAQWNGRLLGNGVGGDAGVFNYSDMSRRIAEGFATMTTDSGHKVGDARWMANAKARVDYEHRAVHLTAEASKAIVRAFYGRGADRSYFTGCSGGGRQALKEMQRYPGDFDGVLAGAPGPYMPLQSVRMMWFSLAQKRHPDAALTDADWNLYENAVTKACDAADGVVDGIVGNPMACRFRTVTLLCPPGTTQNCLTAPKLAMLDTIVAPLRDERGSAMDGGLLPGVRTRPGPPSPLLRAMWADGVHDDAQWDEDTFQRTADLAAANAAMPELRADKVDLGPFIRAGGKVILYQGWADPSTNAGPTIDYYAAAARASGGLARLAQSVRLFMAPGMYHCGGGPGANQFGGSGQVSWPANPSRDALWSLIDWVEHGKAPDAIVATKLDASTEKFTRKLCPYPRSAHYDRKGPPDQAASYRCVFDQVLNKALPRTTLVGS